MSKIRIIGSIIVLFFVSTILFTEVILAPHKDWKLFNNDKFSILVPPGYQSSEFNLEFPAFKSGYSFDKDSAEFRVEIYDVNAPIPYYYRLSDPPEVRFPITSKRILLDWNAVNLYRYEADYITPPGGLPEPGRIQLHRQVIVKKDGLIYRISSISTKNSPEESQMDAIIKSFSFSVRK